MGILTLILLCMKNSVEYKIPTEQAVLERLQWRRAMDVVEWVWLTSPASQVDYKLLVNFLISVIY